MTLLHFFTLKINSTLKKKITKIRIWQLKHLIFLQVTRFKITGPFGVKNVCVVSEIKIPFKYVKWGYSSQKYSKFLKYISKNVLPNDIFPLITVSLNKLTIFYFSEILIHENQSMKKEV